MPASFTQLPSLLSVNLSNNLLTSLPFDIGNLQTHDSALPPYSATYTDLQLDYNLLTTLPASLGNAVDLHIGARNNQITCLPAVLTNWCDPSKNNYLGLNNNPIGVSTLDPFCANPAAYTCATTGQVDLSLTLQQLTATPTQWGSYPVKLTISNAGPQAATGVKVRFAKPTGVVYVGGNAYTASQGSFSPEGDEIWNVGSVPAGGSATLTVNYFLLNPTAPVAYAQVTAANETDTDSQPNNGTPPTPAQDDEATTAGGGGTGPCSPDVTPPAIANCPANIAKTTTGTTATATWAQPTATDNCTATPSMTSSHSPGASFPLGTTTVTYTAKDGANNTATCSFNVTVTQQAGGGQIDLSLALQQLTATPTQWGSYPVKLTVSNAGPQAATGVKVKFAKPAGVVYVGGNAYTASQGSFSPEGDEIWNVGSMPTGGSATLTVNYFLLSPTAPVAYAQVTAANETDTDSQPNNGTPPTPAQDDEASTAGGGGTGPCSPDVTPPAIANCPANIAKTTTGTTATATWAQPTATDNCTATPSMTSSHAPGASFPLGTTTVTYTATDAAGNKAYCSFNVTVTQQAGGGQIDLSLALQQLTATPTQWGNYQVKATVSNAGPQAATGVKVRFAKPTGVVYVGGNAYTASQGSFSPDGDEVWTVGSVPAGGSATLTVNYFLLSPTAPVAYAQVTAANETDTDSQPNNGTPPTPAQDDEASTAGGGGTGPCSPDVTPPAIANCPANITKTTTGTTATATWAQPTATDNCTATPSLTSSHSPGASFPLGTTTVTYTATDAAGNKAYCSFNVKVTQQAGGGQIDLSLSLQQLTATPTQWGNYSIKATISNAGPQAATGVKVRFARPNGVVYVGGNAYTASQGSFSPDGDEVWTVGSVPAGGSATLTVNYFLLNPTAPVAYAQVTAANETDTDSQPNNGTPPTPAQDDEASTAGSGNSPIKIALDGRRTSFDRIYPNPATYEVGLDIYSPVDQATVLDFYDGTGRPVARKEVSLQAGRNTVTVEVWEWKSGSYYVIARGEGLPAYGRFLKVWEE